MWRSIKDALWSLYWPLRATMNIVMEGRPGLAGFVLAS